MTNRRDFLKKASLSTAALTALPATALTAPNADTLPYEINHDLKFITLSLVEDNGYPDGLYSLKHNRNLQTAANLIDEEGIEEFKTFPIFTTSHPNHLSVEAIWLNHGVAVHIPAQNSYNCTVDELDTIINSMVENKHIPYIAKRYFLHELHWHLGFKHYSGKTAIWQDYFKVDIISDGKLIEPRLEDQNA